MGFSGVFRKIFPYLSVAASAGGPLGTMAANAIGAAIGVDVKPDEIEDIITKSMGDPETRAKLQQAENDFQLEMKKLGIDSEIRLEEIAAADRASARAREIAVKDRLPAILAISITAGFFSLLFVFAYHDIAASSQTILNVLIGSLGTAWIGIVNYYFGSSSGSAKKTEIMAQEAETKK